MRLLLLKYKQLSVHSLRWYYPDQVFRVSSQPLTQHPDAINGQINGNKF
jgi:hypothetical protein